MTFKDTEVKYGSLSQFFHWLVFILVVIMVTLGYVMGGVSDKALRGQVINVHKLIGISILTLIVLRLIWRLFNPKPILPTGTPIWQRRLEYGVHFFLYICLIVMPLSGWIGSVSAGKSPHLGNINLALPLEPSKEVSNFAFNNIHNSLAIILIVLVSIHILAAFYHYFIKRDNVFRRMWP